jgi:hypothetical protein
VKRVAGEVTVRGVPEEHRSLFLADDEQNDVGDGQHLCWIEWKSGRMYSVSLIGQRPDEGDPPR